MDENLLVRKMIEYSAHKEAIKNFLISKLSNLGFKVQLGIGKSAKEDIYASQGEGGKHLLIVGTYDTLKPLSPEWSCSPFSGKEENDRIFGRGSTIFGCLGSLLTALEEIASNSKVKPHVSVFLSAKGAHALHSINKATLQALMQHSSPVNFCLSVSPQSSKFLGERITAGAKGCVIFKIKSFGHSGNPSSQSVRSNPLHNMIDFLSKIKAYPLDNGNECFGPSSLQILQMESGYGKEDELSEEVTATLGVYYNSGHNKEDIVEWMRKNMVFSRGEFELEYKIGAESYYNTPIAEIKQLQAVSQKILGTTPTILGNDIPNFAWRISQICPMLEYGLPATQMHCLNETVSQEDIKKLTTIYKEFICEYLNN